MPIYRISDFSGGIRGEYATKRAENECAEMDNFWCQGRNLRPVKPAVSLTNTAAPASTDAENAFKNHIKYISSDGTKYLIARQGKTIWIGIPSTSDWTTATTITWKPLLGDVKVDGSSVYYSRNNASGTESFANVGSLLYMADNDPTATDELYRFDSFIHYTGKLTYIKADSAGRGQYQHDTAGYDFNAAGVKAGDVIYFYDHSASAWRVGGDGTTNGYIIAGLGYEGATVTGGTVVSNIGFTGSSAVRPWDGFALRAALADVIDDDYAWQYTDTSTWTSLGQINVKASSATKIEFSIAGVFYVLNGTSELYTGSYGISLYTWDGYSFDTEAHADDYYANIGSNPFTGLDYLTIQTTAAGQCFNTTGKGAAGANAVDYVIVRLRKAGIKDAENCVCSASTDLASTLATGTYQYAFRYYDSVYGYAGNASTPSAVVSITLGATAATMQGWDTVPDEPYDTLQIFRSMTSATDQSYYKVAEIDRSLTYGNNFMSALSSTGIDNGWAKMTDSDGSYITLDSDAFLRSRPGVIRGIKAFNGRLFGFGYGDTNHVLKFSSLYDYEYFPGTDWSVDIDTTTLNVTGGMVAIGANKYEPLVAMVVEGGNFQTNGVSGDNLLLFTSTNAYRWYGNTWSDYTLVNAFSSGCVAQDSLVNAGGTIIWVNQNHVMGLGSGGNVPQSISSAIFPAGIQADMETTAQLLTLSKWSAAYWNNCYLLCATMTETYNDKIYVYDITKGVWFTLDTNANDLQVWDNPGSSDTLVVTASDSYNSDKITALFVTSTTQTSSVWESGVFPFGSSIDNGVHIKRISVKLHGADTSSNMTMRLYDTTKTAARDSKLFAIPPKADTARGFHYISWYPKCDVTEPSLRIETTALPDFRIEDIEIEYTLHGNRDTIK